MISYIEKGAGLHEAIAAAGYRLAEVDGTWEADDDKAVQAIIDTYADPLPDLDKAQFSFLLALSGFETVWDGLEKAMQAADPLSYATLKGLRASDSFGFERDGADRGLPGLAATGAGPEPRPGCRCLAVHPDGLLMGVLYVSTNRLVFGSNPLTIGAAGIAGTAAGTIALTGAGAGAVRVAGTGAGSLALTGAGAGSVSVAGAGAGSIALTGTGAAVAAIAGSGAGTLSLSGAGIGTVMVRGAGAGTLSLTGSAAGVVAVSGAGTGALPLGGSGTGTAPNGITGSGAGSLPLAGSGTGSVKVAGTGSAVVSFTGAGTGAVAIRGVAAGLLILAGSGQGVIGTPGTGLRSAAGTVSKTHLSGWDGRNRLAGRSGKNRMGA